MGQSNVNVAEYLMGHGLKTLLIDAHGRKFSYLDIHSLGSSKPFADTRRKLVFCLIDNDIGGLAGYISLLVADAVPMMLGVNITASQLKELLSAYKPSYIWLPISRKDELTAVECLETIYGYGLFELRGQSIHLHDELSLILATSGSTGSQKMVKLSHQNVLSNAKSIFNYLELNADERPITTLPPSYTYGLSIIHSHMMVGAAIAVTNKTFFDRDFWNFFRNVGATSFGGVPYHYEMLKKLRFTKMELPSLRTMTQAGGRMEPALIKEYGEYCVSNGMRFFTMYGQAEATARMSYLPYEKTVSKAGSIGVAIPGGKFWIEDESGEVIRGPDVSGELVYEGDNVSMGYAYSYEDLVKGDEINGVLRTGDVAMRDVDGYYYIVGRLKRFIKLFGRRINLLDVEKMIFNEGHEVVCAGNDDLLEVYQTEFEKEKAVQIKKKVVRNLNVAPQGVCVYAVGNIPRNESGKVQYSELNPNVSKLLA